MIDYFALLGEPRRPWLDGDSLKQKFFELSAKYHPDVAGAEDGTFANINQAFNTLREPQSRLKHLLELSNHVGKPDRAVPSDLGDAFMKIAAVRAKLDRFLERRSSAASPLGRALLAGESFSLLDEIEKSLALLDELNQRALADLRAADEAWPDVMAEQLEALSQRLAYLDKWIAQLREGVVQLNF